MGSGGNHNPTGKGGFQDRPNDINRKGRPKRATLNEILHRLLLEWSKDVSTGNDVLMAEAVVRKVLHKALIDGNEAMLKEIWDRIEGKPRQPILMHGSVLTLNYDMELTDDEQKRFEDKLDQFLPRDEENDNEREGNKEEE